MLNSLNVVNGIIDPAFDKNTYEYNVYVESDVISLVLDYDSNFPVTIYGNDYLTGGENHVYIEVLDKTVTTYVLTVYKDESDEASNILEESIPIEVDASYDMKIVTPIIGLGCILGIFLLFCLIFKRK